MMINKNASTQNGMTVRAEISARIMSAMVSNISLLQGLDRATTNDEEMFRRLAKESVQMADALIEELNK